MTRLPGYREDVLAPSTRARLFGLLASLGRPMSTDELAGQVGRHPSGVRVHLERLRQAGLVERQRVAQPRGRPRNFWQLAGDALPGQAVPDAYRALAGWLARSIPPTPARVREVEQTGRSLGRELAPAGNHSPAEQRLSRSLTALGFAPELRPSGADQVVFELGNCPYREAVKGNQRVVCALHRGLTLGLLDALGPSAGLTQFVPKDPRDAGCLIEVAGLASG